MLLNIKIFVKLQLGNCQHIMAIAIIAKLNKYLYSIVKIVVLIFVTDVNLSNILISVLKKNMYFQMEDQFVDFVSLILLVFKNVKIVIFIYVINVDKQKSGNDLIFINF
jgi:hypothetical protein